MSGLTLLVVDDDPLMLQMLVPHLEALDVDPPVGLVLTAQTPTQAAEHLGAIGPGPLVVLTDFNLKSNENGLHILQSVEKRRPDAVRILFSGYAVDQIGSVGNAHGFIEKPLRIHDMIRPIEDIIRAQLGATRPPNRPGRKE